ncbi:MAG TPA: tetratricopeptide repeat protein [Woeseiaceae bacterium]|nr:tetratricopeptide repeat protein [Woeseiaceae bacterium]
MRLIATIALIALPLVGVAQLADDEFCKNLSTFEHLSTEDYESLEQWSEESLDATFSAIAKSARLPDRMPDGWLRNQVATKIADCYMTGRGAERDIRKAMAVLEIPASAGHSGSAHMLASIQVLLSNDPVLHRKGFLTLQREADAGSAYSAGKVGWAYALGLGTEKDEQRALEQYFIAAKAGMTYWQFLLAHAYEQGYYGLPVDPEAATYWREFQPKVHVATYECEIAGNYKRGTFPANERLENQYREACSELD